MISDRALSQAVADAVVTADQAVRLRAIEAALTPDAVRDPNDDESLRFVTGFADIFVTIGIVLFLGALAFIMDARSGSTPMYAGLAACAWLLAEFFTLKRRMALPSIALLVVFVVAVFILSAQIFAALSPHAAPLFVLHDPTAHMVTPPPNAPPRDDRIVWPDWAPLALAALTTAALAALHYVRFRVPITVAAGVAALCILAVTLVAGLVPNITETAINLVLLVCGLVVFALAMRIDISDPARATRRTDIAFWLHLLAAPLIVHPLIRGFLHGADPRFTPQAALGVLWIFLALGFVAVVIDRRAILVSGLVYAGAAMATVVRSLGYSDSDYLLPSVALTLGAFILLLSAGWGPLRRAILKRLPTRLAGRLPHPLAISQA